MRFRTKSAYQIVSQQDVSHAAARRISLNVVRLPNATLTSREVLLEVVRKHRKQADIAFVFLWDDRKRVAVTPATARAMFVRRGLAEALVPPFPKRNRADLKDGVVWLENAG